MAVFDSSVAVNTAAATHAQLADSSLRSSSSSVSIDMEDPFGPNSASQNAMTQSSASTSYTIMSPRAFSASPLVLAQKGPQEGSIPNSASGPATSDSRHAGTGSNVASTPTMNVTSPSTIMRAVSPPTPAPSPQPDLGTGTHVQIPANAIPSISSNASHATPSHPGSVLMAHSGSAAMGEPGTPVSPGTEDAQGLAWGDPNVHIHPSHFIDTQNNDTFSIDPEVQEALFAEQFINSVVSYFPRLTGPERRTLFTSLLPYMAGGDLLHLSRLISPYLRRDFLAELPAEVALKILAYIDDPKDLMRASRVSRTWRSLVADEHNWKLMLEKYNGGGWSEARPALSSTSSIYPTSSVTAQARNQQVSVLPVQRNTQQQSAASQQASKSSTRNLRPPHDTVQDSFYGVRQVQASTSSPIRAPEEDNLNHFLQENQTPLAKKSRKGKGKSRASDVGEEASATFPKDLYAAGFSESDIPGSSTPGTVGLMPAMVQNSLQAGGSYNSQPLRGLGVIPPRRGNATAAYQTSPSAASVLAAQQQSGTIGRFSTGPLSAPLPFPFSHSMAPQSAIPYRPVPPQNLTSQLQQLSLHANAPPMVPTLSIPTSNRSEAPSATSSSGTGMISSSASPSATFAPAYSSPAPPSAVLDATHSTSSRTSASPNVLAGDYASPVASRIPSVYNGQQSQSAPQPARVRISKSQNPFGTAQTNLTYTSQYAQNKADPTSTATASTKPFSFKTQFKKAYLTESNWLKGPGRVLSRQTCTDDGVVTSLGFDNEWIIVGMATNQIHVFDAKTGAYVQQLVGHTLGVWCLVLVSKGGQRLDKDGKKTKSPNIGDNSVPSIFKTTAGTSWDGSDEEEASSYGSSDEDKAASPSLVRSYSTGLLRADGMERTRSASARPADRETFFQDGNESIMSSPHLGVNDGSPQARAKEGSNRTTRRLSSVIPTLEPSKTRRSNRRPSSFCGVPSSDASSAYAGTSSSSAGFTSNPSGFPFGGNGSNISPQQAAACGTAQGWGQPGAVAVSGGCDRDVRVWDVATG